MQECWALGAPCTWMIVLLNRFLFSSPWASAKIHQSQASRLGHSRVAWWRHRASNGTLTPTTATLWWQKKNRLHRHCSSMSYCLYKKTLSSQSPYNMEQVRKSNKMGYWWAFFFKSRSEYVFFVWLSALDWLVRRMMICDSNYVKRVDMCKGAANWNQYTKAFITNRQAINIRGALQLNFYSTFCGLMHYSRANESQAK